MNVFFYASSAVAIIATAMVITRRSAMHALLYLIVSLLAVAVIFFVLGAPFAAALEVIIYAGAIMVLFVFVIMMLNLGSASAREERSLLTAEAWAGPAGLAAMLLAEVIYIVTRSAGTPTGPPEVGPKEVARSLFGPYALGVELASLVLLAGLVGVFHLGRRAAGESAKKEGA